MVNGGEFFDKNYLLTNHYIDSISFSILDSISFENNNPDKIIDFATPVKLDFQGGIEKHSPEYDALATIYYTSRCMDYYNELFENKINFNHQKDFKNVEVQYNSVLFPCLPPQSVLFLRKAVQYHLPYFIMKLGIVHFGYSNVI